MVLAITPTTFYGIQTIHRKGILKGRVHAWQTIKTPRSLSKEPIRTQLPRDYTLQKRPAEKCQPFLEKGVYYLGSRGRNSLKGIKSYNEKFIAERLTIQVDLKKFTCLR